MIKLVSKYFKEEIKILTIEKFMDLCKDCDQCKTKCSRKEIEVESEIYGIVFCNHLGLMLSEIDNESREIDKEL